MFQNLIQKLEFPLDQNQLNMKKSKYSSKSLSSHHLRFSGSKRNIKKYLFKLGSNFFLHLTYLISICVACRACSYIYIYIYDHYFCLKPMCVCIYIYTGFLKHTKIQTQQENFNVYALLSYRVAKKSAHTESQKVPNTQKGHLNLRALHCLHLTLSHLNSDVNLCLAD